MNVIFQVYSHQMSPKTFPGCPKFPSMKISQTCPIPRDLKWPKSNCRRYLHVALVQARQRHTGGEKK